MNKKLLVALLALGGIVSNPAIGLNSLEEIKQVLRQFHISHIADEEADARIEKELEGRAERLYHQLLKCSTRKDSESDDLECQSAIEGLLSYDKSSKKRWRKKPWQKNALRARIEMIKHDALSGNLK